MRPDFALSLSFNGISLLQRAASAGGPARGWYLLGDVALDVEDLSGALAVLREEATKSAEADGPEVKLIIPEEQVKYLSVPLTDDNPVAAAEAALEGATPYAVSELVYDWRASDGQLQIAAVARETLDEAEAFARDNRFVPLGFAAAPRPDDFDGEPFFGPSATALTALTPGTEVQGDDETIVIIEGAPAREAPIAVDSTAAPPPEPQAPAPKDMAPPVTSDVPRNQAHTAPHQPDSPTDPDGAPQSAGPASDTRPQTGPKTETAPVAGIDAAPAEMPDREAGAGAQATRGDGAPVLPSPAAVPMSSQKLDVAPADEAEDTPAAGFSSLRAQRDTPAPPPPKAPPLDPAAEGKTPPLTAISDEGDAVSTPSFADAIRARAVESLAAPADLPPDPPAKDGTGSNAGSNAGGDVSGVLARAQSGLGRGAAFVSRRTTALRAARAEKAQAHAGPAPAAASGGAAAALAGGNKMDEAERMTVFGARRGAKQQVGGKPRFLGLMLTAALLIFLLAVAAWASVFVDDGLARLFGGEGRDEAPVDTALSTPEPDPDPATTPAAQTDPTLALPDTGVEDAAETPGIATLTPGLPAVGEATGVTDDLGLARPIGIDALSPEEAEARYAATGIWQRAPLPPAELRQGVLDDLYVASIDTDVVQQDAVALPQARSFGSDTGLAEQDLPPGPNDRFDFDERGLIRPTAEGVVAPGGYAIFLGRPVVTPPARPGETAPPEAAQPADPDAPPAPRVRPETLAIPQPQGPGVTIDPDAVAEARGTSPEAAASAPVVVDQSLRGLRPLPRPDDLSEINERANLGGITIAELAAKRPLIRPLVVERRAAQALRAEPEDAPEPPSQQEAALESAVASALQEAATTPLPPPASRLAVIESVVPKSRPGNISRIVRRAERVQEQETTRVAAAVAPRTVQPRIPSSSSVSRAATQKNAINLRRVNLIGVYGKPSDRRALVRLSNGRYKKVKVGDRVDGGRVTAISDTQLRYQKSGRNLTLKLPQG